MYLSLYILVLSYIAGLNLLIVFQDFHIYVRECWVLLSSARGWQITYSAITEIGYPKTKSFYTTLNSIIYA